MKYEILQGDNRGTLKTIPDDSIDAIITDPPYGIDFLGKSWDANTGALETYRECLRVLKPGGHILAFSAARTYHHLAVTLEQAGFEIRDQIMWIYSSGFPKSQDVGRQIQKAIYGKPDKQRFDPAIMIRVEGDRYRHPETNTIYRKLPDINGDRLKKSHEGEGYGCVFEEVLDITKSAGYNPSGENKPVDIGVNVFRCYTCGKDSAARYDCKNNPCELHPPLKDDQAKKWSGWGTALKPAHEPIALARKPVAGSIKDNVQTWGTGAINIDATRVPYASEADKNSIDHKVPTAAWSGHTIQVDSYEKGQFIKAETNEIGRFPSNVIGSIPDYQKYFYCPKVSRRERHTGCENIEPAQYTNKKGNGIQRICETCGIPQMRANECKCLTKSWVMPIVQGNNHPTVKPIELMKYLIKLITPAGGTVLDPFNGSGSTGCAAVELGHRYIGCELDPAYVEISRKRIEAWIRQDPITASGLFE